MNVREMSFFKSQFLRQAGKNIYLILLLTQIFALEDVQKQCSGPNVPANHPQICRPIY